MYMADFHNIPSAFIRSDTHVTDDDECINCRDLKTWADNINILLARRIRQPMLTLQAAQAKSIDHGFQTITADHLQGAPIIYAPVIVPRYAQTCTFTIYCYADDKTAGTRVILYPLICCPSNIGEVNDSESVEITADSADGLTMFSGTVSVPAEHVDYPYMLFVVYMEAPEYGGNIKGVPDTIVDVADYYVDAVTGSMAGNMLYVTARPEIGARIITAIESLGGGNVRMFIDRPWEIFPVPGTDTLNYRSTNGLAFNTCCLCADSVSDIFAEQS